MGQTIVKQLLTEGEKFLMTFFNPISFADQGVYEVINNLASLAARFILAPVEESSYLIFSSLIDRNKPCDEQDKTRTNRALDVLCNLVKLMTLVGLFIFTFGFNFSEVALIIYASREFATGIASDLLRWQSLYILIISVNGVTEAFAVASMTEKSLKTFNIILVILSLVFIVTSFFLTSVLGPLGFILANCVNMSGRILHSVKFINNYWSSKAQKSGISIVYQMLPEKVILLSFAITFVLLKLSELSFCCSDIIMSSIHLLFGGMLFVALCITVYVRDKKLIDYLSNYFKSKKE